jgi:hypothetical protein
MREKPLGGNHHHGKTKFKHFAHRQKEDLMSANPKLFFSDTDKLLHLSYLLKALDDCDSELAIFKAEHKARREKLTDELNKLRWEVLSGQERLPLEPISADSRPVSDMPAMGSRTQSSAGSGDSEGKTQPTSAENHPDAESSLEERARTRKTKKKLEGQDALIPGGTPAPVVQMPNPEGD